MIDNKKLFPLLIITFAAMGGMLYGYDIGIIAGALLFVRHSIEMTTQELSFLIAAVLGGGAIATLIGGVLADRFGRRRMILVASLFFLLGVALIVIAEDFFVLLMGRLIQGIGVGIVTIAVPLYLAESAPANLRGRAIGAFQLLLTAGILLATLVGLYYTHTGNWRSMFATAAVPALLLFFGCFWLKDSPRWLIMKGRDKEALRILLRSYSDTDAKKELLQIQQHIGVQKNTQGQRKTIASLWQRRFVGPFVLVLVIALLQQLTGINVLLQFSAVILKHAGLSSNVVAMLGSSAITCLNFFITIIALSLIDKIGRTPLLIFGTGVMTLSLFLSGWIYLLAPLGAIKGWLLLAGILGYILGFAIGPGVLIWVIISELLPSKIRSTGMAIALFFNSAISTIFAAVFLDLVHWINYSGIFWLCSLFSLCYFLIAWRFVPETKQKTLEEIEQNFASECVN